jgi:hypothetical protein
MTVSNGQVHVADLGEVAYAAACFEVLKKMYKHMILREPAVVAEVLASERRLFSTFGERGQELLCQPAVMEKF